MAILKRNCAEGGTVGATVSAANSGDASGDAFNVVTVGTGATLIYDDTQVRDLISYKFATGGTSAQPNLRWDIAGRTTIYGRLDLYMTANPAATHRIFGSFTSAGGTSASIGVNTTGKLVAMNSAGGTSQVTTASIPLNQWCRVEFFITYSSTVGQTTIRLYNDVNSSTITETFSTAATQVYTDTVDRYVFGVANALANVVTFWEDNMALGDAWIGPATSQTTLPSADITTAGWTPSSGGSAAWTRINEVVASDTDFVTSPITPSSSVLEVLLGPLSDPATGMGHFVRYRLRAVSSSHSVRVSVMEGTAERAFWIENTLTSDYQTFAHALTAAQANSIVNYSDLRIRFTATAT